MITKIKISPFFIAIITIIVGGVLLIAPTTFAQISAGVANDIGTQLGAAAGSNGANMGGYEDPRVTAVRIIMALLTLAGTVFFVLVVYAGFLWMTAGGEEEKVTKAKDLIRNAIIGLVVVVSAYAITIAATNLALGRPVGAGTTGAGPTIDSALQNGISTGKWW